ncbi:hypothetical protein TD95_001124 [Thielaviopsis punctulata]|uniref:NADPH:adrenodoxin oxidoreductase, mitochondrial n=1 Tax=Thielaviopsis punctulata TaxID=72032 RepID=A0A0F4Z9B7_9PEZI|nr:hypothetical protein TD95_001124 [Thielaviopsis punctulata]
MAVIGAGPAGFYTTQKVMARIPDAKVDMYERLPVPYGLSRFGIAPDHPEVKNCQEKFEEIAALPGFSFIGNVSVGNSDGYLETSHVPLASLLKNYDAVTFAYGAPFDRHLGIPGETELSGIYAAREFVSWYNGYPGFERDFGLSEAEDAVIIGQGNVALDVARILLTSVDVLRKTDITEAALAQLSKSRVKRVHIVGRRGPMQVRLTIKELRELMTIPGVYSHRVEPSLIPSDLKTLSRQHKRLMELFKNPRGSATGQEEKSWSLDFCLSPKSFAGSSGKVQKTIFEKSALENLFDPNSSVSGTGEEVEIKSDLVFRSIGYKSVPLEGFSDLQIGFDNQRGLIKNDGLGRIYREGTGNETFPGLYCSGWAKRGPTGVIASTMTDGFMTADSIVEDWISGSKFLGERSEKAGWSGVLRDLGATDNIKQIDWASWQQIDKAEKANGALIGKEREKFTDTGAMLSALS